MRQVPLSPLSFDPQRVANVPEHPPPSTRLRSCAHIANRRLSRIIGVRTTKAAPIITTKEIKVAMKDMGSPRLDRWSRKPRRPARGHRGFLVQRHHESGGS